MDGFLSTLGTTLDLALVVIGFSLIIFFHELGHFLAARWARIRVLAFAIGFGPAAVSYRKGMGVRRGSSEAEYDRLRRAEREGIQKSNVHAMSPTEYRLNWLPFGGYVKMLGQDDMDPAAVSDAPDSYQSVPVWKRMVVISAGVVMNVILAAVLFIFVFMVGLETEPAKVGAVLPGSPAAAAVVQNAGATEVHEPGLRVGDEVLSIDGRKANSFNDVVLASAMAGKGQAVHMRVRRPGVPEVLDIAVTPRTGGSGLMEIGVGPAYSATLREFPLLQHNEFATLMAEEGVPGLEPGMTLVRVGERRAIGGARDLEAAIKASGGRPVDAEFVGEKGRSVVVQVGPKPELELGFVPGASGAEARIPVDHLLGLTPAMRVDPEGEERNARAIDQGLRAGDVFARIGAYEFPNLAQGIQEIRRHKGRQVKLVLLRDGTAAELLADVSRAGTVGFVPGDTHKGSTLLSRPPDLLAPSPVAEPAAPPAASLGLRPGSRVLAVGGVETADFRAIRAALRAQTEGALEAGRGETVRLLLELPLEGSGERPTEEMEWTLSEDDVRRLHGLSWTHPLLAYFDLEETLLKAENPVQAVAMGLSETRRVMITTYITFARLFEGTVKVEHLKGPVGIAHLGTRIADRGLIWLLFFMALISVNLAVVNFLPLPIVDGGQFLFLLFEQVRGKPVSVAFQNAATAAGLLLIGAMFLIVTYNDIANLFGG